MRTSESLLKKTMSTSTMQEKIYNAVHLWAGIQSPEYAAKLWNLPISWQGYSEINENALRVARKNFPHHRFLGSVEEALEKKYPNKLDLVVAGTPCQSFSAQGKREGLKGTSGGIELFFKFLEKHKPENFVWENVTGLLSDKMEGDWRYILSQFTKTPLDIGPFPSEIFPSGGYKKNGWVEKSAFAEAGYNVAWRILDAGKTSPQKRKRLYLIGSKKRSAEELYASFFNAEAEIMSVERPKCFREIMCWEPGSSEKKKPLTKAVLEGILKRSKKKAPKDPVKLELLRLIPELVKNNGRLNLKGVDTCLTPYFRMVIGEVDRRLTNFYVNDCEKDLKTPCLTVGDAVPVIHDVQSSGRGGSKPLALFYVDPAGVLTSRRLLIEETEVLMGFPPGWTAANLSDGARRRLVGNSMAVSSIAIALMAIFLTPCTARDVFS